MSIEIKDGFKVNRSVPIDDRIVASGSNARTAISYKYEGLRVFDTYDGIPYVWLNNQWKRENESGLSVPITITPGYTETASYRTGQILKVFNANQRRNIKRERKAVNQAGLQLQTYTGDEIPKAFFSQMYHFYASTCDKFGWWGSKYLTRKFFEQLHHDYRHRVVFVAAYDGTNQHQPVGMSFCLTKSDRLYGRYWGSVQDIDCLHFDACYYSPIEWAINNGISIFDPGAGGRHKKRRGFPATPNYSLHRFYDQRLSKILQSYIGRINQMEQQEIDHINQDLPFSK